MLFASFYFIFILLQAKYIEIINLYQDVSFRQKYVAL